MTTSTKYSLFDIEKEIKEIGEKIDHEKDILISSKKKVDKLRLESSKNFEKGNPKKTDDEISITKLVKIIRKATENLSSLYEPLTNIRLKLYNILNIERATSNLIRIDEKKLNNKSAKKLYSDSIPKIKKSVDHCRKLIKIVDSLSKSITAVLSILKIDLSSEEKELENKFPLNILSDSSMETARRIEISYRGKKKEEFINDGKKSNIKCLFNENLGLSGML